MGINQSTYYPFLEAPEKRIRALLFSDTHVSSENMNKFALWLADHPSQYDIVIMPGDFTNIKVSEHSDPIKEHEAEVQVVSTLEFVKRCIKSPIVYIPGNHEPVKLYSYGIDVAGTTNIHKRAVKLDTSLVLVGFGGCLPGYINKNGKLEEAWEGYPYTSEEAYSKDLLDTFEAAYKTFGNVQYVLLAHTGPWDSSTTIAHMPEGDVYAGSKGMNELLKKYPENIMAVIHGHLHESEGRVKPYVDGQNVINPGAVTAGKFGELVLAKAKYGWGVESVAFYDMGYS